jgi:hypothetical protein
MTAYFRTHGYAAAKRVPRGSQRNGQVTVTRVAPEAMRVALQLAGGDRSRIRVLGPATVLVANQPGRLPGAPYGQRAARPVGQLGR